MFSPAELRALIQNEWATDRVHDDVTACLLGEAGRRSAIAEIKSKEAGVFAGHAILAVHRELLPEIKFEAVAEDGKILAPGTLVVRMEGPAGRCLSLERTLLNFLCHLSGIATLTRRFVTAAKPHPTKILATRKTLPGWRDLQLMAVVAGGGHVHRRSLSDGILIKDNHIALAGEAELLAAAKASRSPLHRIEIEVQDMASLERAVAAGADIIMLDNMTVAEMKEAIRKIDGRAEVEISGGVSLDNIAELAALGADHISIGALTHSVKALDLSMDIAVKTRA